MAGYDTVNEDADPSDDHGHGTMVAGVVAARGNNGIGAAGACWRCSVMPVKVIGANGLGSATDIAEGILWATAHGARVINMSFTLNAPDEIDRGRCRAGARPGRRARRRGRQHRHRRPQPIRPPFRASSASPGPTRPTRGTPGRRTAAGCASPLPGCSMTTVPGAAYGDFCGTSSAAAFVSGIAGLARSVAGQLPAEAIAEALSSNAAPVGDIVSTGRLDAAAVLNSLKR